MEWFWVIGFGIFGVGSRFAIDTWVAKYSLSFPFGTLFINVVGCFLAGLLFGPGFQKIISENAIRVGIIVGFCGGFTTFSGFGLQFFQLINAEKVGLAMVYGIGSATGCILATGCGLLLSRAIA